MNKVMRIIKDHDLTISHQELELKCKYTIPVRTSKVAEIFDIFNNFYGVDIKELDN